MFLFLKNNIKSIDKDFLIVFNDMRLKCQKAINKLKEKIRSTNNWSTNNFNIINIKDLLIKKLSIDFILFTTT